MDYVIFAIDNNTDTHTVAKFMRHIDTKRALGTMKGRMVQAIGYWEGILEPSYIMRKDDYLAFAQGYTKGQDAVMVAPSDNRQPAYLMNSTMTDYQVTLNPIREVSAEDAKSAQGWTFNQSSNKYFVA